MEKVKVFSIGQMVTCTPEHDWGSIRIPSDLIYPFQGIGIIIELNWPDKAYIHTAIGEIICLNTDRLLPIKKEKK